MYTPPVSGENIDYDTAQTFSAWWACVRGISETIAYLPFHVMERDKARRIIAPDHPLFSVLHVMPNEEMSSFSFRELMLRNVLGRGNFYAEKERNRRGDIVNIWPIEYERVNVDRDKRGRLVWDISNGAAANTTLSAKDVYHVKGPGNGVVGLSVVELAKETISLGIAAEKFGGGLFGNGAVPSLVITNDGSTKINPDGVKNLLSTWNKRNKGAKNRGKTEYLDKGFKIEPIAINPNDAQFLETRKFQVHEVCRWFRYPVHKLAELDRTTNNNIEAENISFVTDTLMPWIARLESESDISLLKREDVGRYFTKIKVQGVLRGDMKSRTEAYRIMVSMGIYDIDEVRGLEDLNELENGIGKLRTVPMNMVSVEEAIKQGGTAPKKQEITKAHFRLFQSIAQRFVTVETKRLSAISEKDSFKEDAAKFYSKQSDIMINSFSPAFGLALEAVGMGSDGADKLAADFVKDIILDSADAAQSAQAKENLDSLLHSWNTSKAESMAEKIINKVVKHA